MDTMLGRIPKGYELLTLMIPAELYKSLVESADAHGHCLAEEVLLMLDVLLRLEKKVAIDAVKET